MTKKVFLFLVFHILVISCASRQGANRYFDDNNLQYPVCFEALNCSIDVFAVSEDLSNISIPVNDAIIDFYDHVNTYYTIDKCREFNEEGLAFVFEKPFIYREVDGNEYYAIGINAYVRIDTVSTIPFKRIEKYKIGIQRNIALFSTTGSYELLGWIF